MMKKNEKIQYDVSKKNTQTFPIFFEMFFKIYFLDDLKTSEKKSDHYIEAKLYARSIAHGFRTIPVVQR